MSALQILLFFMFLMFTQSLFNNKDIITLWYGSHPLIVRSSFLYVNYVDDVATKFIVYYGYYNSQNYCAFYNLDYSETVMFDSSTIQITTNSFLVYLFRLELVGGNFYLYPDGSKNILCNGAVTSNYAKIGICSISSGGSSFSYKFVSSSSSSSIPSSSPTKTTSTTSSRSSTASSRASSSSSYSYSYTSTYDDYSSYYDELYADDEKTAAIQLGAGVSGGFIFFFILQCAGLCCFSKIFLSKMKPLISDDQINQFSPDQAPINPTQQSPIPIQCNRLPYKFKYASTRYA